MFALLCNIEHTNERGTDCPMADEVTSINPFKTLFAGAY